jgi:Domain of unknown function (DUF4192)
MSPDASRQVIRVDSPAAVLAVVPRLLGFTPETSLVILGGSRQSSRIQVALRYDLPDPPDHSVAAAITDHAIGVLAREQLSEAVIVGYGPGRLVTPVADAIRDAVVRAGLSLRALLRADHGRYWSYLCQEPSCCPAEGVPFDAAIHPAGVALTVAGLPMLAGREALAATIAPVTGTRAAEMAEATSQAERDAARLIARYGPGGLDRPGLLAVTRAIGVYAGGKSLTRAIDYAWLSLFLTRLRIRDDAWARMDPRHHTAHTRLWVDVLRHAQPGYAAAPASLLAFVAWQGGNGALANIALDRALADTPGYSMALLLRDALQACAPPSAATPPLTPEQVAASYADEPAPGEETSGS